ncbi:hypothetical protein E4U21_002433 [Claviceps maximensis]|nr:hypothetical protein E4U21_002433 [Claviceps maximensis]
MKALTTLRQGIQCIHLLNPVAHTSRVEDDIRRCLDLVLTCHRDLQLLIHLRNQHLRFLQHVVPSHVLEHINHVIDTANQGLAEARRIMEKCRPKAHRDMKTSRYSHFEWMVFSAADFRAQEPEINRQNAAVLAELSYLRQITRQSLPSCSTNGHDLAAPAGTAVAEVVEGFSRSTCSSPASALATTSTPSPGPTSQVNFTNYCDLPEPLVPNAVPWTARTSLALSSSPSTCVVTDSEESAPSIVVLGAMDEKSLLVLFGD